MYQVNSYSIAEADEFTAVAYPEITREIHDIVTQTVHLPLRYKQEMLVSFVKDHSLKNEWLQLNPKMAKQIISGYLVFTNLERLFAAARIHRRFTNQLEAYIAGMMHQDTL